MIIIAGAGLAGLSTAFHLGAREYRIVEKDDRPGGLCRTETRGDYQFDRGGHLLHFRDDSIKSFVHDLLGDNRQEFQSNAAVFSKNVLTDYPFQANLHGLPLEVVRDCLVGFVEAMLAAEKGAEKPEDYEGWIEHVFGRGIAEHFMLPFNRKFWQVDLKEVLVGDLAWSIPRPRLVDVVEGALGISKARLGYNVRFDYPKTGGIETLPKKLASEVNPVETNVKVEKVIAGQNRCVLSTGEEIKYGSLVSSMPLPETAYRQKP